jgi:hypothetical protein
MPVLSETKKTTRRADIAEKNGSQERKQTRRL